MRFFITFFFLVLIGLFISFGVLAVWDMPQPKEHFEKQIENEVFFGTEGEQFKSVK